MSRAVMGRNSRYLGESCAGCLTQQGSLPEGDDTSDKLKVIKQAKQTLVISDKAAIQVSDLRERA